MSNFAESLRLQTNSWSSAYLQFETGRLRENYAGYAFVEDDDDKSVYQLALSDLESICYLGCGGKSGVLEVFKKLKTEHRESGNLFFVDKDTEEEPFDFAEDILRTVQYSWESIVCEPVYVAWFLQRKCEPNLSRSEIKVIVEKWTATALAFRDLLAMHTVLCWAANKLNTSFEMDKVSVSNAAVRDDGGLKPSADPINWFRQKKLAAIRLGINEEEMIGKLKYYQMSDPIAVSRGKTLFALLRQFVQNILVYLSRNVRGQINSAKVWVEAMPCTHASLDFIRRYASKRLP